MQIAITAAGFSDNDADGLRRAMATFRHTGKVGNYRKKFIEGMVGRGYEQGFAERCFGQIEGFGEYGFPESHAASFAVLVYVSAWIKCHHPDVFCAAILNSQPMGFYQPAQLVRDARRHGVEVLEADVNASEWYCTLEPVAEGKHRFAVRLGFCLIQGLRQEEMEGLVLRRGNGYGSLERLGSISGVSNAAMQKLAQADALRSLGLDRRAALWAVRRFSAIGIGPGEPAMPLLPAHLGDELFPEPSLSLPAMLLTVLAIKLEDGLTAPALYSQRRVGLGGREFNVLKFRSMRQDAELNGAQWAQHSDPRVTRVGAVIRKLRIDELPQILNVLRGHMSFIGPRPERPEFVAELAEKIPYYVQRHYVKPGITGWAQLCYPYGSSEQDALEKLQYDLYYIKNNTLLFDLAILVQTAEVVLLGKGAH